MHPCHFVMRPFKSIINNDAFKQVIIYTPFQARWWLFFCKLICVNTSINLHWKATKLIHSYIQAFSFHIMTLATCRVTFCFVSGRQSSTTVSMYTHMTYKFKFCKAILNSLLHRKKISVPQY